MSPTNFSYRPCPGSNASRFLHVFPCDCSQSTSTSVGFHLVSHVEQLSNHDLCSQGRRCQLSKETESTSHMPFFLAESSVSAIHLLVIVGDYLLISPLPAAQKGRKYSCWALRRSKNRRKPSFLCSNHFSKTPVSSQQSHTPRQSRE